MSQLDQLVRLRTWELDEKRRILADLQRQADTLHAARRALDQELAREKAAAAGSIEARQAFEAYAAHFKTRVAKADAAIAEKEGEVEAANEEVIEAFQELRKAEIARDEFERREAERLARLEQMEIDELARNMSQRKPY